MVRVIGGIYKGRKLKTIEGLKTRPTPAIVREALFDIVGERISGSYFLDLYAGFGCVGIEALSRGAVFALFVENNFKTASLIKENLKIVGASNCFQILSMPALKSINKIAQLDLKFDYIFLDPPYSETSFEKILEAIEQCQILALNGEIIIQHSKKEEIKLCGYFAPKKGYNYGDTSLLFVKRKEAENET